MVVQENKRIVLAGLPSTHQVHRVIAEGDMVVTHATVEMPGGDRAVAFDLWRLEDGHVAQHWGDHEPWAEQTASGHSQVDGVIEIDGSADATATKALVEATVRTILIDNDFSSLDDFLAGEDYTQHNPRFADGISGLATALAALAEQGITMKYTDLQHVVAEGDFAYAYSLGMFGLAPFVFHDLFRVAGGRAAEHWDVMVPASSSTGRP